MSEVDQGSSRRSFLKLMGASMALAGLNGCYRRPQGNLVPYVQPPEETIPGRPVYFATAMPFNGYARGVLAMSTEGRPIKIEGNPDHPASLGATDVFMQASVLDLYDPDRSRGVTWAGQASDWGPLIEGMTRRLDAKRGDGRGVRLLTGPITSPTFIAQLEEFRRQFPNAIWHQHDPMERTQAAEGTRMAFGQAMGTSYDFSKADVILSLGADFLIEDPDSLRYARQFIDGRRVRANQQRMNRLYVVESTMTITGSMADHRLAVRPTQVEGIARAIARGLGINAPDTAPLPEAWQRWVGAVVEDLRNPEHGGATAVVAGEGQPAAVQALAHAINQRLGNVGRSVFYREPVQATGAESIQKLVADMESGAVDMLLIIGGNPVYTAPAELKFGPVLGRFSSALRKGTYANFSAHLGLHEDETSFRCQWHAPGTHYLESWGDVRAADGTASIIQPLIAPLYGGKSMWEFMEIVLGRPTRGGLEILQDHWRTRTGGRNFDEWWVASLQRGVIEGTTLPTRAPGAVREAAFAAAAPTPQPSSGVEILFRPDPTVWDGSFANNAWLQELPKPLTKLTWDNAVIVGMRMAEKLGKPGKPLIDGDVVRLNYRGRTLEAAVILQPGQADDMVTLTLGYGRTRGGNVATEDGAPRGFNAYTLRFGDAPWIATGATIAATGKVRQLVVTRNHHAMAEHPKYPELKPPLKPESIASPGENPADVAAGNRRLVRTATLEQFKADPHFVEKLEGEGRRGKPLLSLYPGWDYEHGYQWGMTIDMTACIGCNACVIGCQAENNISVVGKEEVARQREMHWIRIDDYYGGTLEDPTVYHQPVPCMHCENAPCEVVCPVGATTHSDEGINEMTYNRCIGTRYCSNNCPYKVRRFNFFLYAPYTSPSLALRHNPDVTVRSRGVMEKCTYCIQRINRTRIEVEREMVNLEEQAKKAATAEERDRLMQQARTRERQIVNTLQTACQQACPTEAIIFGNTRDLQSPVSQAKREPLDYGLLIDLTTKPRTSYLARIRNPNPRLSSEQTA